MNEFRRIGAAFGICVAAAGLELLGAATTRSLALTADGLHSLIHVAALGVALAGAALAIRKDGRYRRWAATINAAAIIVLAVLLAFESAGRLMAPQPVMFGAAFAITAFGLAANGLTILALGGGSPVDINHRAVLWHMLGDAAVAVLALIGLAAALVFGWTWADAVTGLVGALVLTAIALRLLRRTYQTQDSVLAS